MSDWIEWKGGANPPVKKSIVVDLEFRDGSTQHQRLAGDYYWEHDNDPEDIIAYRVEEGTPKPADPVNHPPHYTAHPSGVECIQVTEHMGFNLGNAVKYIWRCDSKKDAIEDLKKARWYIDREITRREQNK